MIFYTYKRDRFFPIPLCSQIIFYDSLTLQVGQFLKQCIRYRNDNVLSAVSASDVKAGIDLKNLGAGTHNVTVALSLPDGITVVGNVTVNVTITAIQQETTTESTKATESTTSATR